MRVTILVTCLESLSYIPIKYPHTISNYSCGLHKIKLSNYFKELWNAQDFYYPKLPVITNKMREWELLFLNVTCLMHLSIISTEYHQTISKSIGVMEITRFYHPNLQAEMTKKLMEWEFPFQYVTCQHVLAYIHVSIIFHQAKSKRIWFMQNTQEVIINCGWMNGQMNGWTKHQIPVLHLAKAGVTNGGDFYFRNRKWPFIITEPLLHFENSLP